jgi:hypothetical protein
LRTGCSNSAHFLVREAGSDNIYVRVGGIYALESIGYDSPQDRTTIIYGLVAFIRDRSRMHPSHPEQPSDEDLLAALRVAARLTARSDVVLDLRGGDLRNRELNAAFRSADS